MKKVLLAMVLSLSLFANDIIIKESSCSVDATVQNIKNILKAKGLSLFGVINHAKNAKNVSMKLSESQLIIFGNPKLGTKLMQQDMTMGLDLPLKILVYKDVDGGVKMAYRDGAWLVQRHTLKPKNKLKKIDNAMDKITNKAGQCKKD